MERAEAVRKTRWEKTEDTKGRNQDTEHKSERGFQGLKYSAVHDCR